MDIFTSLSEFIAEGKTDGIFPKSAAVSIPVLTQRNGRIFRATFLYNRLLGEEEIVQRPFAWILIPIDGGNDFAVNWCSAIDFVQTESFPLESMVSAKLNGDKLTNKTISAYYSEVELLMSKIVNFAFAENLDKYETEMIERYRDLFLILCYRGFYSFYDTLAPDFFGWIGLVLIANRDNPAAEAEIADDRFARLSQLIESLESHLLAAQEKDLLFSKLHEELQSYKTNAFEQNSLAMQKDVILIIDHIEKNYSAITNEAPTPAGYKKLLKIFENTKQDLIDALYRQSIDPYTMDGNTVDVNRQKVLSTMDTTNSKLDKTVAKRISQGWSKDGKVIRPEYVEAYLYSKNTKTKN